MKKLIFRNNSLVRLFILIISCVFFVEFGLMYFLEIILDDSTHLIESLADAFLLSIVISPVLYIFSFRYLIKEIKNHKEAEEKFKSIFDSSEDSIMTLYPPKWNFFDGNLSTLKMFNLKDIEQLKEITPGDLSPQYQPDGSLSSQKAKDMIDLALKKGRNFFEWTHKKIDGPEFLASVSLTKIEIGKDICLQAVVRDISEERKNAEALIKKTEETKKALLESEKINKLMVGRELEMVKLKKELIELKNK